MKKALFLIALAMIFLIGADSVDYVQFTIINKSGMDIAFQLQGQEEEELYYLTVPAGGRNSPREKTFRIVKDTYSVQGFYLDTFDPETGRRCKETPAPSQIRFEQNVRIVIRPCISRPANGGEKTMLKYWPRIRMNFRDYLQVRDSLPFIFQY